MIHPGAHDKQLKNCRDCLSSQSSPLKDGTIWNMCTALPLVPTHSAQFLELAGAQRRVPEDMGLCIHDTRQSSSAPYWDDSLKVTKWPGNCRFFMFIKSSFNMIVPVISLKFHFSGIVAQLHSVPIHLARSSQGLQQLFPPAIFVLTLLLLCPVLLLCLLSDLRDMRAW